MREIWFRAWDKELKRMCDVYVIDFFTKQISVSFVGASSVYSWEPLERFVLLQYTGLKDKNGAEICDGDIIDCSYISPMTNETIKRIFKVVFTDGVFKVECIGHSPYGDTLLFFENKKGKVVGNIYENPELLEVK